MTGVDVQVRFAQTGRAWDWRMIAGGVVIRSADHFHPTWDAAIREIRYVLGIMDAWSLTDHDGDWFPLDADDMIPITTPRGVRS